MNENLKELTLLMVAFPDLEVLAKVDEDLFTGDFGWYKGSFGEAKICHYYENEDGQIYMEDEIWDSLYDCHSESERSVGPNETKEEFSKFIDKKYEEKLINNEIKKAIFIEVLPS